MCRRTKTQSEFDYEVSKCDLISVFLEWKNHIEIVKTDKLAWQLKWHDERTGSSVFPVMRLLPAPRQAITWTNAESLSTGSPGTDFSDISINITKFSVKKKYLKTPSAKCPPILFRPKRPNCVWAPTGADTDRMLNHVLLDSVIYSTKTVMA